MKKQIFGKRLKRSTKHRKALLRGLMREMIIHGQMKTTEAKAKAMKGELEKAVTKAMKSDNAERDLRKNFKKDIANRLIVEIAPKFKNRPGGYTRLTKIGRRTKDNSPMVLMEWVEKIEPLPTKTSKKSATKKSTSPKQTRKTDKVKKEAAAKISKKTTQAPKSKAKQQVRRVQKKG